MKKTEIIIQVDNNTEKRGQIIELPDGRKDVIIKLPALNLFGNSKSTEKI